MKSKHTYLSGVFALAVLLIGGFAAQAADAAPSDKPQVNYVVRVDWNSQKNGTNFLQLITTEGTFKLDGTQASTVKLGDSQVPITGRLEGTLKSINATQGQLQLFLGRTVPFVTYVGGKSGGQSIQQLQEGLNSTFIISFGKRVVIQKEETAEVSVLVERVMP